MYKKTFPVVVLVGQRNVGKSTLFNRLTSTNSALISRNELGCTRDRQYGYVQYDQYKFIVIDTGGFYEPSNTDLQNYINNQIILAIKEACIVFFMVNSKFEISSVDYSIADYLRKLEKDVFIIVNKVDDVSVYSQKYVVCKYYDLGMKNIIFISAIHGYGVTYLLKQAFLRIQRNTFGYDISSIACINNGYNYKNLKSVSLYDSFDSIKLAIVGRPNTGKSTFVNFVLKTNRMITSDIPGTTRDSICIPTVYNNQKFVLVDTAGIRKRKKINDIIERMSVLKTLHIFRYVHIILFMIDANEGIVDQDLSLLKLISNYGKSLVVVVNKWDKLATINMSKDIVKSFLYTRIQFLTAFKVHFISSLYGNGIKSLFKSLIETYNLSIQTFSTSRLTKIMYKAVIKYPPPLIYGTRIAPKLKYVHIGDYNPITIIIHGTRVSQLTYEYRRYLKNFFYQELHIDGILIHIKFKDSKNPFVNSV